MQMGRGHYADSVHRAEFQANFDVHGIFIMKDTELFASLLQAGQRIANNDLLYRNVHVCTYT